MSSRNIRFGVVVLAAGAALALGCSKEGAPAAEQPKKPMAAHQGTEVTPALAENPASGEGADELASAKISDAKFDLEIKPKGSYSVGKPGNLEIVLSAKGPYHCNDKYPYKFKLEDSAGVKFANKVVKKDAVKLEHTKATMTVAFTPETAGGKTIAGQFHFSLCSEDKCLIEKRKLAVDIKVD
jgi:hypothetical protein